MMKMQYCFWCGEELGLVDYIDPYEHCGKPECAKEARYAALADQDERRCRAEEDDYNRY